MLYKAAQMPSLRRWPSSKQGTETREGDMGVFGRKASCVTYYKCLVLCLSFPSLEWSVR